MSNSILILSPDVITDRMAGPAIRYWEFAKALVNSFQVTLAIPNSISEVPISIEPINLVQHQHENIDTLIEQHDIIIFQGFIFDHYPSLQQTSKILIADLYDPVPLEGLEQGNSDFNNQVNMMNSQLKKADYFLCASDRQRDLWLGHLLALGRINSLTYKQIQQRIITIPFGLPDTIPQRTDVGFEYKDSFILLWGGGIWEWFDPLTVIRAIHHLLPDYPNLKLIFLGTRHPNPTIPIMPKQKQAEILAKELGLYNKQVIFQNGWVPYASLANYLLDADVGVSSHFDTLETHFSFRTRILHYLWANKPIITTSGDVLADAIIANNAGIVVEPENESDWITAIKNMYDPDCYSAYLNGVKTLAEKYRWSIVTEPLQNLCANASLAPDMTVENGLRKSQIWDCEYEYNLLKNQLAIIENSNSWRITESLRAMRRFIKI
ncbi:glycosyltransferase [Candidatus Halobeggiatoa sp. HSG11]|nr:glycosyltransferase [Candidatus Halobeggiatoa sp. HSG11]